MDEYLKQLQQRYELAVAQRDLARHEACQLTIKLDRLQEEFIALNNSYSELSTKYDALCAQFDALSTKYLAATYTVL